MCCCVHTFDSVRSRCSDVKHYVSDGDFGVVEMYVCLLECSRVYVHMKNPLCFVSSSSAT